MTLSRSISDRQSRRPEKSFGSIKVKMQLLNERLYVAPQISPDDLKHLKSVGVTSVIAARPEGETKDQPPMDLIRAAADEVGIQVNQIPVVPGQISAEQVAQFRELVNASQGIVLAYCRSGMRACMLWALDAAEQGMPVAEILRTTQAAGHDISKLAPRLDELANSAAVEN